MVKVVGTKENIVTSILFGYAGFINIGFKDVFTLYAATAKSYKGYDMEPNETGFTVFIVTCMKPILTIILIPKITKLIGLEKSIYICFIVQIFLIILIPIIELLPSRKIFYPFMILTLS